MAPRKKNDPFGNDAEGDVDDANQRDAEEVARGAREKTDDEDVVIDLDKKDDDDDPDDKDDKTPVDRPSRKDKKRERGQSLLQAERDRAERAEAQTRELTGKLAEALGRMGQPTDKKTEIDPLDKERDDLTSAQEALAHRWTAAQRLDAEGKLTAEEATKLKREANDLNERIQRNTYKRIQRDEGGGQPRETPEQATARARLAAIDLAYPDVAAHPKGREAWLTHMTRLVRLHGKPDNEETLAEAMEWAREDLRLPARRPPPSTATRRRHTAMSVSSSGAGDREPQRQFVMTKQHRINANAAYAHIKDVKKRYEMYARDQMEPDE